MTSPIILPCTGRPLERHKLGKGAPKHDVRNLLLARYLTPALTAALPPTPASRAWSKKAKPDWGVMLNDELGCCLVAAKGHAIQVCTANDSTEVTVPDSAILAEYERVFGYVPGRPETDQGGDCNTALNDWVKNGIGTPAHKATVYMEGEPKNHLHVKAGVNLNGFAYCGVGLPLCAQNEQVWHTTTGPGSGISTWGGHAIVIVNYDAFTVTFVSWGVLIKATWAWFDKYCDEVFVVLLAKDWTGPDQRAPNGFLLDNLIADQQLLTAKR